ncbi:hypothetical protein IBX73_10685 [candidate division WOR-3 bacterium]|nr:hypothetical protein [candidate division WOR-3 bacterium]
MNRFGWVVCIVLVAGLIESVHAMVIKRDQVVNVAAGDIIDDDLIAVGGTVDIKGTVTGNVCAFAQSVNVSGDIGGSLFTCAATVDINAGSVQTIWAAGGNISVSGDIAKNVVLFGGSLSVNDEAVIGKDLRAYGGNFSVNGVVNGTTKGSVGNLVMAGQSGPVKIKADKATVKSTARVNGDLQLQSSSQPSIEEGAAITGEVTVRDVAGEDVKPFFFALTPVIAMFFAVIKVVVFIAKVCAGILLIVFFRPYVRRIMDTLKGKTWASLGWGFLGIIVMPVAVVLLFAILIGYPLGFLGVYAYTVIWYLSSIFVSIVIGERFVLLFRKKGETSLYLSYIVGILILTVVGLIPILGWLVSVLTLLFGFGAVILGTWRLLKEMREKQLV